jgi:hypothetical protein
MSLTFSLIVNILSLLNSVLRISKDLFFKIFILKRNKKIKDRYKQIENIVENGDVDEINKTIRDNNR